MTAQQKAAAALAAVFLLGGAGGFAAGRASALRELNGIMAGPPGEARGRMRMRMLTRRLALRDDQIAKLQAIFDEADAERDKLVAACGPGLDDLRRRTDARVRDVLDDQQRRMLDDLRLHHGGHHHGPPFGP